jgi:hypothetical protein
VWLISTRGIGSFSELVAAPDFAVYRRAFDGSWASSSIDEFLTTGAAATPTCFVIHGNRVSSSTAIRQGMMAYRQFTAGLFETQPVRFVIWSWPSDRIHGILKDVRAKAARSTTDGKYLAWTLHRFDPEAPVSLVGFSYGARIATGALHVLAGGSLDGFSLAPAAVSRRRIRLVLAAAGLHNHWLAEGHYHGQALQMVDAALLINNRCDMALKRYRFVDTSRSAAALGYTGPVGWSPYYAKIRQADACRELGKAHDWDLYLESPRFTALIRQTAWPDDLGLRRSGFVSAASGAR